MHRRVSFRIVRSIFQIVAVYGGCGIICNSLRKYQLRECAPTSQDTRRVTRNPPTDRRQTKAYLLPPHIKILLCTCPLFLFP